MEKTHNNYTNFFLLLTTLKMRLTQKDLAAISGEENESAASLLWQTVGCQATEWWLQGTLVEPGTEYGVGGTSTTLLHSLYTTEVLLSF